MSREYRTGGHALFDLQYHVCRCAKYRYAVMRGEIAQRCREFLRQIAVAREITIIRETIAPDHAHMLILAPASLVPAKIARHLKGASSRQL